MPSLVHRATTILELREALLQPPREVARRGSRRAAAPRRCRRSGRRPRQAARASRRPGSRRRNAARRAAAARASRRPARRPRRAPARMHTRGAAAAACSTSGISSRIWRMVSNAKRSLSGASAALVAVGLDQRERRDQQRVEQPRGAVLGGVFLGQRDRLVLVARDQPLVEARFGRQHRLDAEQHIEVAELRDVAAHHRHAHGQRHGEQQPDRPPQPGPEDRRDDDRDRPTGRCCGRRARARPRRPAAAPARTNTPSVQATSASRRRWRRRAAAAAPPRSRRRRRGRSAAACRAGPTASRSGCR